MPNEPYVNEEVVQKELGIARKWTEDWMRFYEIRLRKGEDPDRAWTDSVNDLNKLHGWVPKDPAHDFHEDYVFV